MGRIADQERAKLLNTLNCYEPGRQTGSFFKVGGSNWSDVGNIQVIGGGDCLFKALYWNKHSQTPSRQKQGREKGNLPEGKRRKGMERGGRGAEVLVGSRGVKIRWEGG